MNIETHHYKIYLLYEKKNQSKLVLLDFMIT